MARQRRGGFRPPELKGTLGTLLRTTLQQAGVVRDALERGAREGRSRLDEVMAGRRRQEALAELGEVVLELIRQGEIDIAELPEARSIVAHLDELDAEAAEEDNGPRPADRRRFDTRDDGTVSAAKPTWAPPRRSHSQTSVWNPKAKAEPPPAEEPKQIRKGGISFEDDDLADYMHPDDVPPKDPPKGDS